MERGQKIALVGANGLGKTTLLKSLLGKIKPISGDVELGDYQYIGYFEQEIKEANDKTCIEEVWRSSLHTLNTRLEQPLRNVDLLLSI
ncbi:ATPase subunit of ABC transporter with duplicated ATPase domains [Clostridium acetobutylicum]|nr:ATPase subunit of ABC transporter with duplicated ATPase domains [Clostridium acetobutylicum]